MNAMKTMTQPCHNTFSGTTGGSGTTQPLGCEDKASRPNGVSDLLRDTDSVLVAAEDRLAKILHAVTGEAGKEADANPSSLSIPNLTSIAHDNLSLARRINDLAGRLAGALGFAE